MTVSDLPPQAEVVAALRYAVAPAAGAATAVFVAAGLVLWRLTPRWREGVPAASVLAVAAAVAAGNYFRQPFPWWPDGRWWHWAAPACALAVLAELSARCRGASTGAGALLRGVAAATVAAAVLPAEWREPRPWLLPALALPLAVQWQALAAAGRRNGPATTFGMSAVAAGVSAVLLHHKTIGYSDVATVIGVALFGLGLLGLLTRTNTSAAAAVASVPLVALLVLGQALSDPGVPPWVFAVVGLLPFVLCVPVRGPRAMAALPLVAFAGVAACIIAAMQYEPLRFSDDW